MTAFELSPAEEVPVVCGSARPDDPLDVFEHWARACMQDPHHALGPFSAAKYRSVWRSWLRFLAAQEQPPGPPTARTPCWARARTLDVVRFVDQLNWRRLSASSASDVSRRRYWRVLERIYDHARVMGWCRHNPARNAPNIPPTEQADAVVLPPSFLAILRRWAQGIDAEPATASGGAGQAVQSPREPWLLARDSALLALVLDSAATTAEIAALRLEHITDNPAHRSLLLRLDGPRPAQRRTVELSPWAATALNAWLGHRSDLLARGQAGPEVFLSRKSRQPLTPKTVFVVLRSFIARLEHEQHTRIAHRGANLIRSSVLAQWLHEGATESEVLARAGLDQLQALRRLAHARTTCLG